MQFFIFAANIAILMENLNILKHSFSSHACITSKARLNVTRQAGNRMVKIIDFKNPLQLIHLHIVLCSAFRTRQGFIDVTLKYMVQVKSQENFHV